MNDEPTISRETLARENDGILAWAIAGYRALLKAQSRRRAGGKQ